MIISMNTFRFWYIEDESSATFMNWLVQVSDMSNPPKVFSVSYGKISYDICTYLMLIIFIYDKCV